MDGYSKGIKAGKNIKDETHGIFCDIYPDASRYSGVVGLEVDRCCFYLIGSFFVIKAALETRWKWWELLDAYLKHIVANTSCKKVAVSFIPHIIFCIIEFL